jgi:hypothetical protein
VAALFLVVLFFGASSVVLPLWTLPLIPAMKMMMTTMMAHLKLGLL